MAISAVIAPATAATMTVNMPGSVLVNLARIAIVGILAAAAGYLPAILFHDYGGTLLLVAWLFAFWFITYRWLLPGPALALEPAT